MAVHSADVARWPDRRHDPLGIWKPEVLIPAQPDQPFVAANAKCFASEGSSAVYSPKAISDDREANSHVFYIR